MSVSTWAPARQITDDAVDIRPEVAIAPGGRVAGVGRRVRGGVAARERFSAVKRPALRLVPPLPTGADWPTDATADISPGDSPPQPGDRARGGVDARCRAGARHRALRRPRMDPPGRADTHRRVDPRRRVRAQFGRRGLVCGSRSGGFTARVRVDPEPAFDWSRRECSPGRAGKLVRPGALDPCARSADPSWSPRCRRSPPRVRGGPGRGPRVDRASRRTAGAAPRDRRPRGRHALVDCGPRAPSRLAYRHDAHDRAAESHAGRHRLCRAATTRPELLIGRSWRRTKLGGNRIADRGRT